MKYLCCIFFFIITNSALAYEHLQDLPPDFDRRNAWLDKNLTKYGNNDGLDNYYGLQIVDYTYVNTALDKIEYQPIAKIPAYTYMVSYKNFYGYTKHLWMAAIKIDHTGRRIRTYIVTDGNDYKLPFYEGKTYRRWLDWYNDTFFTDATIYNKYLNPKNLVIIGSENKEILDKMGNVLGVRKFPIYKFRYYGSKKINSTIYHSWLIPIKNEMGLKYQLVFTENKAPPTDFSDIFINSVKLFEAHWNTGYFK